MGRRSTTNAKSSEYESASEVQFRDIKKSDDDPIIVAYGNSKPEYQYVTNKQYNQYVNNNCNKGIGDKFSYKAYKDNPPNLPDSGILRDNMHDAMSPEARKWYDDQKNKGKDYTPQAHHIVAGKTISAKGSRKILKECHIDINDSRNGIFLPYDEKSDASGIVHRGPQIAEYDNEVYERLQVAVDGCTDENEKRKRVFETLDSIKEDLFNAKSELKLSHNHRFVTAAVPAI